MLFRFGKAEQNEKIVRDPIHSWEANAFRDTPEMWSCVGKIGSKKSEYPALVDSFLPDTTVYFR